MEDHHFGTSVIDVEDVESAANQRTKGNDRINFGISDGYEDEPFTEAPTRKVAVSRHSSKPVSVSSNKTGIPHKDNEESDAETTESQQMLAAIQESQHDEIRATASKYRDDAESVSSNDSKQSNDSIIVIFLCYRSPTLASRAKLVRSGPFN